MPAAIAGVTFSVEWTRQKLWYAKCGARLEYYPSTPPCRISAAVQTGSGRQAGTETALLRRAERSSLAGSASDSRLRCGVPGT